MNNLNYKTVYNTQCGNAIGIDKVDNYEFINTQHESGLISNIYEGTELRCIVLYNYIHDRMDYNVLFTDEVLKDAEIENLLVQFTEQFVEE